MYTIVQSKEDPELYVKVTNLLHELGAPTNFSGFHYLREAIIIVCQQNDPQVSITRMLYPSVARKFESTPSRVERCIRHLAERLVCSAAAIEKAEKFGLFAHTNNGYLITRLADEIRTRMVMDSVHAHSAS